MESFKSSPPEVFSGKGVLKICSKFTGERPCRSVILIKLLSNFIEITPRHGCSANLLYNFRTPFPRNTPWRPLGGMRSKLTLEKLKLRQTILVSCFYCEHFQLIQYSNGSSHPQVCCKKVFLKISNYSQENLCVRVSILIKLKAWGLQLS